MKLPHHSWTLPLSTLQPNSLGDSLCCKRLLLNYKTIEWTGIITNVLDSESTHASCLAEGEKSLAAHLDGSSP
jgi:hypothetical protein